MGVEELGRIHTLYICSLLVLFVLAHAASLKTYEKPMLKSGSVDRSVEKELGAITRSPTISFTHNAEVRNSIISGSVYITNDSTVLIDNVTFLVDTTYIYIKDNSDVVISNTKFVVSGSGNLYIYTFGSSRLTIVNVSFSSVNQNLYVHDQSSVLIENTNMKDVYAYENANVTIIGPAESLYAYLMDNASLLLSGGLFSNNPYVTAHGKSVVSIRNANFTGDIYIYDHAEVYGYDSYIDWISLDSKETYYFHNVTFSDISVKKGVFYMEMCNISSIYVRPSESEPLDGYGPHGTINNSYVNYASVYSFTPTLFVGSYVEQLVYANVFVGSVDITPSGITYDDTYDTYIAEDTTITTLTNDTYYVFVRDSDHARIYNVSDRSVVFLLNVRDARIEEEIVPWSSIRVYGWNSTVNITRCKSVNFDVDAHNSTLLIRNITPQGTYSVRTNMSYVDMDFVNASAVSWSSVQTYYSTVFMDHVIMNSGSMDLHSSVINISYAEIRGTLTSHDNYVALYNVDVDNLVCYYVEIRDGFAFLSGGMINGTSLTADVIFGIVDYGNNTVGWTKIDTIEIHNTELNISGSIADSTSWEARIYTYKSKLIMEDVPKIFEVEVIAYNGSEIRLTNTEVEHISVESSSLCLDNVNVSGDIDIQYGNLTAYNSTIDTIDIENSSIIEIYGCNISNINAEPPLSYTTAIPELSDIQIHAYESNISEIMLFGKGSVTIEESSINTLVYTYQSVLLNNTNINGMVLNNTLFTEGEIEISNNVIVSGTPTHLLTTVGTCSIAYAPEAILLREAEGLNVELTMKNSTYFAVVSIGGSVHIESSNLSVVFSLGAKNISIVNTEVNGSSLEEVLFALASEEIYLIRSKMISMGMLMIGGNRIYVDHVDTLVSLNMILVIAPDVIINALDSAAPFTYMYIMNSTASFSDSNIVAMEVMNSSISVDNTSVSNSIGVGENSYLHANNSNIGAVDIYWDIDSVGYLDVCVENSEISSRYTTYYLISDYMGTAFNNDTIDGDYTNLTTYRNTVLTGADRIIMFRVTDYGRARIENYTDKAIEMLYVDTIADTEPPTIEALNGTSVSYEYGLGYKFCFRLSDETPIGYAVYINNTKKMDSTYTNNEIICMNLSDYISASGSYIMRIVANDSVGYESSLEVHIEVHPQEPPEIVLTPKESYSIGVGEELTLKWKAEDKSPARYRIYQNGEKVGEGEWSSGQEIQYKFKSDKTGTYNITIVFYDKLGQHSSNTVNVEVTEKTTGLGELLSPATIAAILIMILIIVVIILAKRKKSKQ